MPAPVPALRQDLEFHPIEAEGQSLVLIRDRLGLVPEGTAIPADAFELLTLFERESDEELLGRKLALVGGGQIGPEAAGELVRQLTAAHLLETEDVALVRRQEQESYAAATVRPPSLAGDAYPDDPAELRAALDAILNAPDEEDEDAEDAPDVPAAASGLAGLVVPHIDLAVGGPGYAAGYRVLRDLPADQRPKRVVILGVGHQIAQGLYCLTDKAFATPLGQTLCDAEAVARLTAAAGQSAGALAEDDFVHRYEHSIEFQLLFLQHLLGPESFQIVPILCGSACGLEQRGRQGLRQAAGPFLEALAELAGEPDTLVLAGVDFCHIGPKFGHDQDAVKLDEEAADHDMALLERLAARDADGFWAESNRVEDRYNVCGLTALATLAEVLPAGDGAVLEYRLWHEQPTRSAVGFGAAVFPR